MNRYSEDINSEFIERLEAEYKEVSQELPSPDLDKQIIAAAHRELENPNKLKRPNNSWWRRLSLPTYAVATFAFTAIATHLLLPEPVGVPPGTSPRPVKIDLVNDDQIVVERQARKPKKAPEYKAPTLEPELATHAEEAESDFKASSSQDSESEISAELVDLYTEKRQKEAASLSRKKQAHHLAKLSHPEKEKWARQILELFKKGEFEKAQKELVRFKKVFPDFPIDAQIEAIKSM